MKKLLLSIIALMIISCGAKQPIADNANLIEVSKPTVESKISPEDFEKSMPESSIIRQSLIIFENTFSRVYSVDNVIDALADDEIISVLKNGEIGFSMPMCSSLVLDGTFGRVGLSGYNAVVWSPTRIDFYSAYDCVRYASLKKAFIGPALILGNVIAEWKESKAVIRNAYNGDIIFNGETGGNIVTAGMVNDKIVVVHDNGYIMSYRNEINAFAIEGRFPLEFSKLFYSAGVFYGTLKTGEFFTVTNTETNITSYKDCNLSSSSPFAMCGDILTNGNIEYKGLPVAPIFSAGDNFYLTIKESTLNIYKLTNSWQRFVSFGYDLPKGCVDGLGDIYYKGFSGNTYKISKEQESKVDSIPQNCDFSGVIFEKGNFICNGSFCGKFAEYVTEDTTGSMYKRFEEGKVYYFFNENK